MRPLLALAALLALGSALRADDLKAALTPPVEKFLEGRKNAGLVVGVLRDGKPHVHGYGTVFLPRGEFTPDGATIFEIGSITKALTGVLLADAVRRGEINLDAPAQKYLPPDLVLPKVDDTPITLGHLATHYSGLPVQPPLIGLTTKVPGNPYSDYDRKQLAAVLAVLKPTDPPGKKHRYSNLGAGLVGHALVHTAKADSYDALLRARVCQPLGLKDTAEALTGSQRARFARAHKPDGTATPHWDFGCLEACGGVRSTANDMLAFAAAALGVRETALGPAFRDSFASREKYGVQSIGLFWIRTERPGDPLIVWHNGSTYGHRAILIMYPEAKAAVVVLSSVATEEVDKLALTLSDVVVPPKKK